MLVLLLILVGIATAQILSIDQIQGYKGLRECALNCYNGYGFDKPGYNIASELSCQPYNSPGDACFCRTDLQNIAVDGLSSCVAGSCRAGADLDISSATQIYKDYCTSAGYTQKAANVPAKTTGATLITTTSPSRPLAGAPTATSTSTSDSGSSTPASSTPMSGLSLSAWIGIIGGVVGAIASVAGAFWGYKRYQHSKAIKDANVGVAGRYYGK